MAAELEAEVLATAADARCKPAKRARGSGGSTARAQLDAVRAALGADGADPWDALKAIQAALSEEMPSSEGSDAVGEDDEAEEMSMRGEEPFHSAGEEWMRRTAKGRQVRSRSTGGRSGSSDSAEI